MTGWNVQHRRIVAWAEYDAVATGGVAQTGDDPFDEFELVHGVSRGLCRAARIRHRPPWNWSRRVPPCGDSGRRGPVRR